MDFPKHLYHRRSGAFFLNEYTCKFKVTQKRNEEHLSDKQNKYASPHAVQSETVQGDRKQVRKLQIMHENSTTSPQDVQQQDALHYIESRH